jgi:hypothetical protein
VFALSVIVSAIPPLIDITRSEFDPITPAPEDGAVKVILPLSTGSLGSVGVTDTFNFVGKLVEGKTV